MLFKTILATTIELHNNRNCDLESHTDIKPMESMFIDMIVQYVSAMKIFCQTNSPKSQNDILQYKSIHLGSIKNESGN